MRIPTFKTMMKVECRNHVYLYAFFVKVEDLIEIIYRPTNGLSPNYRALLISRATNLFYEFYYQGGRLPILQPDTFLDDLILVLRRMELKVKSMVFGDMTIDWDNPVLSDYVLTHQYVSENKSNNTPFANTIDFDDTPQEGESVIQNKDYEEYTKNVNYEVSKFSINQRIKRVKWEDIDEQIIRDLNELFWRKIPHCCKDGGRHYA